MSKKIRFDINPHVIKQLGEELVSDEITALMEIVKNSYDADANYVSIDINTTGSYKNESLKYKNHVGYIVVEDDGFGMDEETILKSWLTISYSNKRAKDGIKPKTPKGRTPLGDKGLGRLSTQRLAEICEIFTSKESSNERIHVAFNWKDFESFDSLGEVPVTLVHIPKKKSGTTLVLSGLNNPEIWKGENLEEFKGLLSQMISPYKKNRPFEVYIQVNGQKFDLIKENEDLRDIALAKYDFEFDGNKIVIKGKIRPEKLIGNRKDDYFAFIASDNGQKFGEYLLKNNSDKSVKLRNDKYLLEFEKEFDINFDLPGLEVENGCKVNPGPFLGEINEFTYDTWLTSDETLKSSFDNISNYKKFAQSQAGIKLYRNGFAVKPFGLDGQDWMKLGEAQTKASSYYYLRPVNVIGYIAISESENKYLKEKTDREGLISNAYSKNFMTMMFFVRDTCNLFIEKIRRSYNDFLNIYKTENTHIKTVSQAFSELKSASEKSTAIKSEFRSIKEDVKATRVKTNNYIDAIKNAPLFSTDEDRKTAKALEEINVELTRAENLLTSLSPIIEKTEQLSQIIDVLEPRISTLEEQLENFSELASLGLTAETVSHEFASIADKLAEKSTLYSQKLTKGKLSESDIFVLMEYINSTVSGLKIQLKHIDPSLKYNKEKKQDINLSGFFNIDEYEYYQVRLNKNNIKFQINIKHDFDVSINKGKLTQIFDNIINNSEYWLKERIKTEPTFLPEINIIVEKPWVYIFDNGHGIAPAVKETLFEPFVTTKPKGKGRGLGLFIVQQLLDSSGCTISVEPQLNELKRHYIFSLNLSNIIKQ